MAYDITIKNKAKTLRKAGYSIKEIANTLNIAQSSSSLWVRDVKITTSGKSRMIKMHELKRYKMAQSWIKKRDAMNRNFSKLASIILGKTNIEKNIAKIICATLFWAEGSKKINHIAFTNSDPIMIKTFLGLLRKSYSLDESKFHVSVHLHEYHNPEMILGFWSTATQIPLSQFIKPYLKPHTSKQKHDNYNGCITIRYYDVKIARELTAIYNALGERY